MSAKVDAAGAVATDARPALHVQQPRFVSYAQNLEDVMLWRALSHVQDGFYVDVGAHDPVLDSVSKAFYERGWTGVDIEPIARQAALLREDRPRNVVLQCAIAERTGRGHLYVFDDSGLSTLRPDQAARNHETLGLAFQKRQVETRTLREVFASTGRRDIHWLKIDVEGAEGEVLRSWKGSDALPWIVVVEATRPNETQQTHHEWEVVLTDAGYRFTYFDGLNRFYVSPAHPELIPAFEAPPNVFDRYSLASVDRLEKTFAAAEHYAKALESEVARQKDAMTVQLESHRELDERRALELRNTDEYLESLRRQIADKDAEIERALALLDTKERADAERGAANGLLETSRDGAERYAESLAAELSVQYKAVHALEAELATQYAAVRSFEERRTQEGAEALRYLGSLERELASRQTALDALQERRVVEHADALRRIAELVADVEDRTIARDEQRSRVAEIERRCAVIEASLHDERETALNASLEARRERATREAAEDAVVRQTDELNALRATLASQTAAATAELQALGAAFAEREKAYALLEADRLAWRRCARLYVNQWREHTKQLARTIEAPEIADPSFEAVGLADLGAVEGLRASVSDWHTRLLVRIDRNLHQPARG